MQVSVYNTEGAIVGQLDLDEGVFGIAMNEAVVHQAVVRQQANARQGTSNTKTRAEVAGSSRKLYRQKHTGRARAGNLRSPLRRHGGITFGPRPRSYRQAMPKKMRRLAIRCVLSDKLSNGELKVISGLKMNEPKTKQLVAILQALQADRSSLIALPSPDSNAVRSADNLKHTKVVEARLLNVLDLVSYRNLIMTTEAVRAIEQLWGTSQATGVEG